MNSQFWYKNLYLVARLGGNETTEIILRHINEWAVLLSVLLVLVGATQKKFTERIEQQGGRVISMPKDNLPHDGCYLVCIEDEVKRELQTEPWFSVGIPKGMEDCKAKLYWLGYQGKESSYIFRACCRLIPSWSFVIWYLWCSAAVCWSVTVQIRGYILENDNNKYSNSNRFLHTSSLILCPS